MAATAAMIAEVRRMVDEPGVDPYTDILVTAFIEAYPLIDVLGTDPQDVDFSTTPPTISELDGWIPTYDLHAAAADIWVEKAGAVADEFDFKADGGSFSRSQKEDKYMAQSRYHLSRRAAKASRVFVNPRIIKEEESNSD